VQQQRARGLRGFVQSPVGRVLLIALTIGVVFGAFVYASLLLAIPAFLIFGLGIPIYAGIKRPRYVALAGLVVILAVSPLVSLALTDEIMTPSGIATSSPSLPDGNGGSVLQSAQVTPFNGDTSTNFTWTVTVYPQYLANTGLEPRFLHLYLSTCPGATSANESGCNAGYLFKELTINVTGLNLSKAQNFTFRWTLGVTGIWDWQMSLEVNNTTAKNEYFVYLVGDPNYDAIEGPVVGTSAMVFEQLLPTIYLDAFLFLGIPFYFVLLLYMYLKNREKRRKEIRNRAAGPIPPTSAAGSGGGQPPTPVPSGEQTTGPPPGESACPNCGAVIYPAESKCWKCGADLKGSPSSVPSKPLPPG